MNADISFLDAYLSRLARLPDFAGIAVTATTANALGTTPLHIAAMRNECEAIVALARSAAVLDARGEHGFTPLHEAAAQGHVAAVGVLVALGAATGALDADGNTPRDVAACGGHKAVVECLRRESLLDAIVEPLEQAQTLSLTIPRETILGWTGARSVEELGALCRLVQAPNVVIEPPLSFAEYADILLPYLRRCLDEDPSGEWVESRESAATTFRYWFAWLWRNRIVSPHEFEGLKHWLRRAYEAGDAATRRCLVDATLEPLFDDESIVRFFADWQHSPVTMQAYSAALAWREGLRLIDAA
jgi:hypothetical protein